MTADKRERRRVLFGKAERRGGVLGWEGREGCVWACACMGTRGESDVCVGSAVFISPVHRSKVTQQEVTIEGGWNRSIVV